MGEEQSRGEEGLGKEVIKRMTERLTNQDGKGNREGERGERERLREDKMTLDKREGGKEGETH